MSQSTEPSLLNPATPVVSAKRVFFTGRLRRGKDFCAAAIQSRIVGFAEPLYALQEMFFGAASGKDQPGARRFLQTVGQWGRGLVDDRHPITPERASFIASLVLLNRAKLLPDFGVDWKMFGLLDSLWVDALLRRVAKMDVVKDLRPVSVVNCRFENEQKPLENAGFVGFHVVCSAETWAKRLAKEHLTPESPEIGNTSEALAAKMDASVQHIITKQPQGPKLRVIWCDEAVPCPSPRFLTVPEFVSRLS